MLLNALKLHKNNLQFKGRNIIDMLFILTSVWVLSVLEISTNIFPSKMKGDFCVSRSLSQTILNTISQSMDV